MKKILSFIILFIPWFISLSVILANYSNKLFFILSFLLYLLITLINYFCLKLDYFDNDILFYFIFLYIFNLFFNFMTVYFNNFIFSIVLGLIQVFILLIYVIKLNKKM